MKTGTRTQVPDTKSEGIDEDLAALVAQLLFLVGLERPVVDEGARKWQHVERDRARELHRLRERNGRAIVSELCSAVDNLAHLLVELVDTRESGA